MSNEAVVNPAARARDYICSLFPGRIPSPTAFEPNRSFEASLYIPSAPYRNKPTRMLDATSS
jgi:hypothetical protein